MRDTAGPTWRRTYTEILLTKGHVAIEFVLKRYARGPVKQIEAAHRNSSVGQEKIEVPLRKIQMLFIIHL